MMPVTPPAMDLSRSRLKALTIWIRNELDPLIAREGPDVLRSDDVLTLHETFVFLRQSSRITAMDIRATGIHRAIQDIAGVATRWPSRLCDDCDKIIALWTTKFGQFNALHPFLYGRGGRLEGIASVADHTREALLKRWAEVCPEQIHPKRSHRLGDLGFRAGDWWINTLFAHHAGIIGLESVEGGTTFDKHGAYALVLEDTGEVEATSEEHFTYRVPHTDKGKYRLTSAKPASRDPIRVLRSQSINSIWGPKAGVRYEGLFRVTGWSIRNAKAKDAVGGEYKEGTVMFEIKVERIDHVPMDEVTKRPTATEVDDYTEYKRMRKLFREGKRSAQVSTVDNIPGLQVPKIAPAIHHAPPAAKVVEVVRVPIKTLPGPSRAATFRRMQFDSATTRSQEESEVVSPGTVPDSGSFPLAPRKHVKFSGHTGTTSPIRTSNDQSSPGEQKESTTTTLKDTSSLQSGGSGQSKIHEVTPWIDFELEAAASAEDIRNPIIPKSEDPLTSVTSSRDLRKDLLKHPGSSADQKRGSRLRNSTRKDSGELKGLTPSSTIYSGKSKANPVRIKNPMTKLFDGVASEEETDDYFGPFPSDSSTTGQTPEGTSPQDSFHITVSADNGGQIVPQTSTLTFSPESPFAEGRRNALIYFDVIAPTFPSILPARSVKLQSSVDDDPFITTQPRRRSTVLPVTLKALLADSDLGITAGNAGTVINSGQLTIENTAGVQPVQESREWLEGADIRIAFRNPFTDSPGTRTDRDRRLRDSVEYLAPDVVN